MSSEMSLRQVNLAACRVGIILIVGLCMTACAGRWPYFPWAEAPLHAEPPPGQWHIVHLGETWDTLAARAGVPKEDLFEINGRTEAQAPREGQVVFLLAPDRREASPRTQRSGPARRGSAEPGATEHRPGPADGTRLAWPIATPVVSSQFGRRWGRNHEGIDLAGPLGLAIFAADDGSVIYADNVISGYGNMIIIEHTGGLLTAYAHNSVLLVEKGDRVRRGQMIARLGQSGRATAPHLHFEVRVGEEPQDPLLFLPPLK